MSTKRIPSGSNSVLKPPIWDTDQPVFEEQWQAQALALAELLIQSGKIDAKQWSKSLGKHLKIWQSPISDDDDADNMRSYYHAVLDALTELIDKQALLSSHQISQREQQWEQAYLSTPHGHPVKLADHMDSIDRGQTE